MLDTFDVAVVGAGHAGLEAALAAARLGMKVGLFTFDRQRIAQMSCNPAIGGVAKGQMAREVDALGGAMGYVTDQAMLHFRMLNRSKGPAVQSPRAQCDRQHYSQAAAAALQQQSPDNPIQVFEGEVSELLFDRDPSFTSGLRVIGLKLTSGQEFFSQVVILTTGTFLKSLMHQGEVKSIGGRVGEDSAEYLSSSIAQIGLRMGRLKTGTPARLHRDTIDWSRLEAQSSEPLTYRFSHRHRDGIHPLLTEGLACHITYTNERTHAVIRASFHRSPLFSGEIQGIGPRYCPSIEDKVKRFADKPHHQIFLEPDGLDVVEIYPNGVSTSLPADVQLEFLRTIEGLEAVELVRPGYAVEYDYVDPTQLWPTLAVKSMPNLFLAGQINGTSGYEEAAGQGLVAGTNAALYLQHRPPFILGRDEAYIGVLIDDLVTRGATEPYRMFTSRAEHRLLLRQDNADLRLTAKAAEIGLVPSSWQFEVQEIRSAINTEVKRLRTTRLLPRPEIRTQIEAISVGEFKKPSTLAEILERTGVTWDDLNTLTDIVCTGRPLYLPATKDNHPRALAHDQNEPPQNTLDTLDEKMRARVIEQVEITIKYRGYLERQERQIQEQKRMEKQQLPSDLDYLALPGMRMEARHRLDRVRPLTLGQAARIEGVSPADIAVLMAFIKKP